MKYLGIDYGSKNIGIAISDESGGFAFPKSIIPANTRALAAILDMVRDESIETIVVGNSLNQAGMRNEIMEDIDAFVEELHKLTGIPVVLHDERFSSSAVRAFDWAKPVASPHRTEKNNEPIDDRAAAIMLQRFLDRK